MNEPAPRAAPAASGVSALQVAKQTLFSLVPIYYSCNKQQSNDDGKQLSLDQQQQAQQQQQQRPLGAAGPSASSSLEQSVAAGLQPPGAQSPGRPDEIYATINRKGDKRPAGISVLEIGNQRQAGSHYSMSNGVNVISIASQHSGLQRATIAGHPAGVFKTINQQQRQLAAARQALSEDVERFRVHSNGQLLDLLMRQNWCESVITEKINSIERLKLQTNEMRAFSRIQNNHQHIPTTPQPECGLPEVAD